MTLKEILDKFHTLTDDQTELSTQEEIDLANNVYQNIYRNRHWEWLKTAKTGSLDSFTSSDSHINLPDDFIAFTENNQATDNSHTIDNNSSPKVVYIIQNGAYIPYQIVNWSDRRNYQDRRGFCYLDLKAKKIIFTAQPEQAQYEFDYIGMPDVLSADADEPVFSSDFHIIIAYGMKLQNYGIQLFDRSHSYAPEDTREFDKTFKDMCYENAQLQYN